MQAPLVRVQLEKAVVAHHERVSPAYTVNQRRECADLQLKC